MIGRKGLSVLVGLTVVAGLAAWGLRARSLPSGEALPERVFPGLSDHLNDVSVVSVTTHDAHFTLRQQGEEWGADEKDGHPVHFDKLKSLLISLSTLRPLERKTASPALHARLGLAAPAVEGSTAVEIKALSADGATLVDLLIGNPGATPNTRYVRKAGDDQTWLAQGDLQPETTLSQWVDTEVMRLEASTVSRVNVTQPDGEVLNIAKQAQDDPSWTIEAIPEGSEPKATGSAASLAGALGWLDFDDVAAAAEHPLPENDRAVSVFETWDGLRVTVTAAREPAEATPTTAGEPEATDGETPQPPPTPPNASEPTDWIAITVAASDSASDEVRAKAETLNARLAPWIYKLGKYKASTLRPSMSDLTQPKPPAPPEEPAVTPETAPDPDEAQPDSGG